jgi:hypothetical protein
LSLLDAVADVLGSISYKFLGCLNLTKQEGCQNADRRSPSATGEKKDLFFCSSFCSQPSGISSAPFGKQGAET